MPNHFPQDSAPSMELFMQFTSRLAGLWCWLAMTLAHLALLVLVLFLLWATQTTPDLLVQSVSSLIQSKPYVWASGIGFSVLGAAYGYWRLVRWANRKLHSKFLWRHLTGLPG
jgi:uncharacterized membrane protein